jgi:hypothetical protein
VFKSFSWIEYSSAIAMIFLASLKSCSGGGSTPRIVAPRSRNTAKAALSPARVSGAHGASSSSQRQGTSITVPAIGASMPAA